MTEEHNDGLVLEMHGVSLSFGAVQALQDAEFELRRNEVMALVGENGAGKSSLVKILAGLHRPDSGEIVLEGQTYSDLLHVKGPVAVVQQELSLVPTMSAAENVFLGHPRRSPFQSRRRLVREARPFLEQAGLTDLDPEEPAGQLRVAERQLVEVARLVARDARVLIFDEPTAALADNEIERVKAVVRELSSDGRGIIYVTHRLDEVFELSGSRVGLPQRPLPASGRHLVARHRHADRAHARAPAAGHVPSTLGGLRRRGPPRGGIGHRGAAPAVSLSVRKGEILGLAGQLGSGTTPFLRALAGSHQRLDGGDVRLADNDLAAGGPAMPSLPASPTARATARPTGCSWCETSRRTSPRRRSGAWPSEECWDEGVRRSWRLSSLSSFRSTRAAFPILRAPSARYQQKVALGKLDRALGLRCCWSSNLRAGWMWAHGRHLLPQRKLAERWHGGQLRLVGDHRGAGLADTVRP